MLQMSPPSTEYRRKGTVSASPSPTPQDTSLSTPGNRSDATTVVPPPSSRRTTSTQASSGKMRQGRWTLEEKLLFLYGLRKYGKGRWKKISVYLPNRSLVQIKSHAQKVIKRYDTGEDVFARLDDNLDHVEAVVQQLHEQMQQEGLVIPASTAVPLKRDLTRTKRNKATPVTAARSVPVGAQPKMMGVHEEIVAASALFQLSGQSPAPAAASTMATQLTLPRHATDLRTIVIGSNFSRSNVLEL